MKKKENHEYRIIAHFIFEGKNFLLLFSHPFIVISLNQPAEYRDVRG